MNKAQRVLEELERMDELSKKAKVGLGALGAAGLAAGAMALKHKLGHEGTGGGGGVTPSAPKPKLSIHQAAAKLGKKHGTGPDYIYNAVKRKHIATVGDRHGPGGREFVKQALARKAAMKNK